MDHKNRSANGKDIGLFRIVLWEDGQLPQLAIELSVIDGSTLLLVFVFYPLLKFL